MKKLTIGVSSFIAGALLMTTFTAFADTAKQFVLTNLKFPVIINGTEFKSDDLPFMNYNGNTYVPLKKVGDMLDVPVNWNDELKQVEIGEKVAANGNNGEQKPNDQGNVNELVWYEWIEMTRHLNSKGIIVTSTVIKGQHVVVYGETEYVAIRDRDYYNHSESEKRYYKKSFLLKFLSEDDLTELHQYKVDINNQKVT